MIEIPALEQPMYAQHELQEIQLQFHQTAIENRANHATINSAADQSPSQAAYPDFLESPTKADRSDHSDDQNTGQACNSTPTQASLWPGYSSVDNSVEEGSSVFKFGGTPQEKTGQFTKKTPEMPKVSIFDDPRKHQPRLGSPLAQNSPFGADSIKQVLEEKDEDTEGPDFVGLGVTRSGNGVSLFGESDQALPNSDFYNNSDAFMLPVRNNGMGISNLNRLEQHAEDLRLNMEQLSVEDQHAPRLAEGPLLLTIHSLPELEGAPMIDQDAQMNDVPYTVDGIPVDATPLGGIELDTPIQNSSSRAFAGVPIQISSRLESSPQLPSPLSSKPLRLALSQGKEFSQMRKLIATEMKNPAEYSLHILFTQFVRHAERKLNRFIDYPLDREPPILDILAEGVDPQFDNMIASLGYIAKRKPKPVIDSVMYWRKSKSEVASMAYGEVERIMDIARSSSIEINRDSKAEPVNSNLPIPTALSQQTSNRSKRSLSLIRRKSPQKPSHKRNASASVVPMIERLSSFIRPNSDRSLSNNDASRQKQFYEEEAARARATAIQAERKSLASIYILCRVLIEVVRQISSHAMGLDLSNKLEEIVYNQLKTTDPIATSESFVRLANWNLFAELLGYMSEKRFLQVSDRFIADLEKVPAVVPYDEEPRLHLLIHGMRCLKLTNYPLEKFEESAEFIQSLTKFFCNSTSHTVVYAYADVLSNLILPLAPKLTAEANHPLWVEAVGQIYNKSFRLWQASSNSQSTSSISYSAPNAYGSGENNDWDTLLTLMTSAISVSSKDLFSQNWFRLIESNAVRLKPKVDTSSKTKLVVCASRLVWVYINRLPDTLNNTVKRLDSLFDLLFFGPNVSGRKQQWIVLDNQLINGLCEIIRVVGYQHYNYVLENVILRILRSGFPNSTLEGISPEKLIIVINSYMLCLKDHKTGAKPEFPSDEVLDKMLDAFGIEEEDNQQKSTFPNVLSLLLKESSFMKQNKIMSDYRGLENFATHEEIYKNFTTLLKLLDSQCGVTSWTKNESTSDNMTVSKSFSSISNFNFGLDFSQSLKNSSNDLFVSLLDASAWSIAPILADKNLKAQLDLSFQSLVEILIRNSIHQDPFIASSSLRSLAKLASHRNAGNLINIYARIAFRLTEKPGQSYDSQFFNSNSFLRLLRIYVELLKCWLRQFSEANSTPTEDSERDSLIGDEALNDLYQINYKAPDLTNLDDPANKLKPYEELEWKTIVTVIESVEGNGLFFLCSGDSRVRQCAVTILRIVEQFDQSIYDSTDKNGRIADVPVVSVPKGHSRTSSKYVADEGSRLIRVIDNIDLLDLLKPLKKEISAPEKARLSKIKSKKGLLFKFASSENSIDSTIWFRIYPSLLDNLFETCPIAVALCRSIVCFRLVQMHELVVAYSENFKSYTTSLFARQTSVVPPELIINQWKLYLIFACCSLTSTNDQVISIPLQPNHGRKKSLPMYIQYQKITSAKSVFRMVLPLLKASLSMVREAVVAGLSSVNINICRTLTENLPESMADWNMDLKKRDSGEDLVRIEVVQILSIITYRLRSNSIFYADEVTLANLVNIIKNVKKFLSLPMVQILPEFQRLRHYFSCLLENVYIGLKDKADLNRWLPFEARIGCFNFLQEWCGFGDSRTLLEERFNIMTKKAQLSKEPEAMIASLDYGRKSFQISALSCMATICSGNLIQTLTAPQKIALISFDIKSMMRWVNEILGSKDSKIQEIGKTALNNILASNINNDEIFEEALAQCYSPKSSLRVREVYFTLLVDSFIKKRRMDRIPCDMFCICLFLIGSDNFEIRFAAVTCIKYIETEFYKTNSTEPVTETVCSSTMMIYKKALVDIAVQFASTHGDEAYNIISYMSKFSLCVDTSTRKDIMSCLVTWLQTIKLKYVPHEPSEGSPNVKDSTSALLVELLLDLGSLMILNNLFELSVKFGKDLSSEIQALWVALGTNTENFSIIFDFIIDQCLKRKSSEFVAHSRQIVAYLVFSRPDSSEIIDKLVSNLLPKAMVPTASSGVVPDFEPNVFPYTANISKVLSVDTKESPFSLGQLSMVFLVDLFRANRGLAFQNLPLLLHISFSLLDHYLPLIQEQAISLLIHLTQSIAPNNPKSLQVMNTLRSKNHVSHLWVYDDLNGEKNGGITPKNMDTTVRTILELFTPSFPTLQKDWSHVSLKWATSCAVRHIACRSFQLFRSLLSFLDQPMLKDMLHRLSNTIADESVDIQGFAMQILMTLNAITAELDCEKLINFPQLFWASVACLSTVHEHEFIETISTMSKFVSKIDLDSQDTISCLLATFPPKWDGKFVGLQETIIVGLRSSTAWGPTIKFLDRLTKLKDSEVIGSGENRLFITVIANLPRFLHALDEKSISPEVEEAASLVSQMASLCNKPGLSKILDSLAKNKFRLKKDFLKQIVFAVRNCFFPEYEFQALVLLLNFLSNKISWVKIETLSILKLIFPIVNWQKEEFMGIGADLIAPLLRLLLTEHAEQALEVIDEAVAISGSQLDKDILRMSMGNPSMRKEYEQTATLFGIPDSSGWAVPMPAVTASKTRHNVHAVFATCITSSTVVDEKMIDHVDTEQIQFLMDDYRAPERDFVDTSSMNVEEPPASLSNMWAALDDFDSFFTKPSEQRALLGVNGSGRVKSQHVHSVSVDTKTSSSSDMMSPVDGIDSVPQVYDKKALVILNQILARTQSNASFKSGLSETIGSPVASGRNDIAPSKRSYIPFRHSRFVKTKTDAMSTPAQQSSSIFELASPATPSKSSVPNTPNLANFKSNSPQDTILSPESRASESKRFDHILSARKRNRRG